MIMEGIYKKIKIKTAFLYSNRCELGADEKLPFE